MLGIGHSIVPHKSYMLGSRYRIATSRLVPNQMYMTIIWRSRRFDQIELFHKLDLLPYLFHFLRRLSTRRTHMFGYAPSLPADVDLQWFDMRRLGLYFSAKDFTIFLT
jgi:hypothetical protein